MRLYAWARDLCERWIPLKWGITYNRWLVWHIIGWEIFVLCMRGWGSPGWLSVGIVAVGSLIGEGYQAGVSHRGLRGPSDLEQVNHDHRVLRDLEHITYIWGGGWYWGRILIMYGSRVRWAWDSAADVVLPTLFALATA